MGDRIYHDGRGGRRDTIIWAMKEVSVDLGSRRRGGCALAVVTGASLLIGYAIFPRGHTTCVLIFQTRVVIFQPLCGYL